jgi:hypothetical protein
MNLVEIEAVSGGNPPGWSEVLESEYGWVKTGSGLWVAWSVEPVYVNT